MSIRIIVAEDVDVLREELVFRLNDQLDMEVVGEASTGAQAVLLAREGGGRGSAGYRDGEHTGWNRGSGSNSSGKAGYENYLFDGP